MRAGHSYILILLLALLSCRREPESARDYDLGASHALLATGEALLADGAEASPTEETMAQLASAPASQHLAEVLRTQWQERELIHEANRLLSAERYNDLAELLERAQREGMATSQLLELTGLPQALQALRLYCARRPYERAADLEQNLDFLRPWVRQLQSLSPAFQSFYQEQQAQLLAMRQQEADAAEEGVLRRLDWLLVCQNQRQLAPEFLSQAAEEFPQLPILRLLQRNAAGAWQPASAFHALIEGEGGFMDKAGARERLSIELSIALTWQSLSEAEKAILRREWQNSRLPSSLTGTFLRAESLKQTKLYEEAIVAWQRNATQSELAEDAPAFLGGYVELLSESPSPLAAWSMAAPDVATAIRRAAASSE